MPRPPDFLDLLSTLPSGTQLTDRIHPTTALALCFVRTPAELTATINLLSSQLYSTEVAPQTRL